jgi:hypothetical protein
MGQDPSEIREELEQTRGQMGETIEAIGYKSDIKARAKDSVSEKVGSVKSKLGGAGDRPGSVTPSGADLKQGAQRAAGMAKENPIGLALAGIAVGFLAGVALPSSAVEDEKLGPVSTQLKETVKDTGEEVLERGKDVAQDTMQSAKETAQQSAQEQGDQLKQSVQESTGQAKQETSA